MYWYNSKIRLAALAGVVFISCFTACKPDIKETGASLKYFDLKGYFEKDSEHLAKLNPLVFKTVVHNGITESKKLHIANWQAELDFFKSSDINKPAWKDNYTIQADSNYIMYRAKTLDVKTRSITIKLVNSKVKWILINNYTKNLLYMTRERLMYFPDSLYQIDKMQAVRVIGINRYKITGAITQ
jgi:hypothetical protein